jgi:hypothetical protein
VPMLTSFVHRAGFLGATFAGIAPPSGLQSRPHLALSPPRLRRPPNAPAPRSHLASVISELASRMRCPGSGAHCSRLALAFEAHAPLGRSWRGGVPAPGRRRRSLLGHHGNLLAYQVPRRGHLHPYKGKRRARIVPPLSGSLRGATGECRSGGICAGSGQPTSSTPAQAQARAGQRRMWLPSVHIAFVESGQRLERVEVQDGGFSVRGIARQTARLKILRIVPRPAIHHPVRHSSRATVPLFPCGPHERPFREQSPGFV